MSTDRPDPYTVLGLDPDAGTAEIAAAYRRAVRACHPDTPHPDRDRLAAVIAAYRQLRSRDTQQPDRAPPAPTPSARHPGARSPPPHATTDDA
jgi:curved DNA-binding protein CbpA